jgi:hypothetical protein
LFSIKLQIEASKNSSGGDGCSPPNSGAETGRRNTLNSPLRFINLGIVHAPSELFIFH